MPTRSAAGECGRHSFWEWAVRRDLDARCAGARRGGARCAEVVRALVVLSARCASVIRALVVRSARRAHSDLMRTGVQITARYAACDRVRSVVPTAGSSCGVVVCRCGTLMQWQAIVGCKPPNTPLQRTRVARQDRCDFST